MSIPDLVAPSTAINQLYETNADPEGKHGTKIPVNTDRMGRILGCLRSSTALKPKIDADLNIHIRNTGNQPTGATEETNLNSSGSPFTKD